MELRSVRVHAALSNTREKLWVACFVQPGLKPDHSSPFSWHMVGIKLAQSLY